MTSPPAPDELPIFPLENVVLFPKVRIPLHTFEPRYRQMTRAALDGDRRIGMVVVRPDHRDEMSGDPPVFPIGCEGVITQAEQLESGSYNIVLLGRRRFRVREEIDRPSDRLYRVARIEALEDPLGTNDTQLLSRLREQCFESVRQLANRVAPELSEPISPELFEGVDDETFANALSQSLDFAPLEKQGLLEADSVRERFERLIGLLRFRLAEIATPGSAGSGALQ